LKPTIAALLVCAGLVFGQHGPSKIAPIRFSDTTLDNGLRVLVAEDHNAPVYAIAVAYKVGSRDERKGRTGFAHLFEHMMFKGSDNVGPGEHFYTIFTNGGSMNGTTNNDRTVYYEILPKNQLDMGLFLEADRMRSLKITQENLENQRQAVKEERRLGVDNQAYGQAFEKMDELVYDNFAYQHSVIGSMADLDAASVDDVKAFFKTYYAPNNAVLALVGDLDTKDTLARVKKYFGDIPRQEPPKPVDLTESPKDAERRAKIEDKLARVPRISIAYRIPEGASADTRALSVGAGILGGGESSRLYQKLVKEKELATQIGTFAGGRAGPGTFQITAMVRPGKSPEEVEALISEEVARFLSAPVTEKELARARTGIRRSMLFPRGSVLSTALTLTDYVALYNDVNRINTEPDKRLAVRADEIQQAAQKYLRQNNRVVVITMPAAPGAPSRPAGNGKN
jgi:predicted Zn-dependent peptidase